MSGSNKTTTIAASILPTPWLIGLHYLHVFSRINPNQIFYHSPERTLIDPGILCTIENDLDGRLLRWIQTLNLNNPAALHGLNM